MPASSSCITIMLTSIGDGGPAGLDHVVRRLAVERVARGVSSRRRPSGSATCSSGPLDVVAQAPEQIFGRGAQVDHVEMARAAGCRLASRSTAPPPVASTPMGASAQLGDHRLLEVAKAGFAFALEVFADRAADALLDQRVGVDEGHCSRCDKRRPDCRFPGAGKADQCDRHTGSARPRASARGVAVGNHLRRDEDEHFGLVGSAIARPEQCRRHRALHPAPGCAIRHCFR